MPFTQIKARTTVKNKLLGKSSSGHPHNAFDFEHVRLAAGICSGSETGGREQSAITQSAKGEAGDVSFAYQRGLPLITFHLCEQHFAPLRHLGKFSERKSANTECGMIDNHLIRSGALS